MGRQLRAVVLLAVCVVGACRPSQGPEAALFEVPVDPIVDAVVGPIGDLTADRPYSVYVPSTYDPATALPLVVLLHGYRSSGDIQEVYFQLEPLAESRGFLYVHPDGTRDFGGSQYWNATEACCAFGPDAPDDVAYLFGLIEQVSAAYAVDPQRIYLAGHSNGGFMSYRMACDHAETIAAIVSLAGAMRSDPADCAPSEPVSVLQIHGTADDTVPYTGVQFLGATVPSAQDSVAAWAAYNGCEATALVAQGQLNLDTELAGADSDVATFEECAPGGAVALWTIIGGSHVPDLTAGFSEAVVDFLLAHPKPT
jgi:polyhydroxybutyrate depolymerase